MPSPAAQRPKPGPRSWPCSLTAWAGSPTTPLHPSPHGHPPPPAVGWSSGSRAPGLGSSSEWGWYRLASSRRGLRGRCQVLPSRRSRRAATAVGIELPEAGRDGEGAPGPSDRAPDLPAGGDGQEDEANDGSTRSGRPVPPPAPLDNRGAGVGTPGELPPTSTGDGNRGGASSREAGDEGLSRRPLPSPKAPQPPEVGGGRPLTALPGQHHQGPPTSPTGAALMSFPARPTRVTTSRTRMGPAARGSLAAYRGTPAMGRTCQRQQATGTRCPLADTTAGPLGGHRFLAATSAPTRRRQRKCGGGPSPPIYRPWVPKPLRQMKVRRDR